MIYIEPDHDAHLPPPPADCQGFLYPVQPGDTLDRIAFSCSVTIQEILIANPQILHPKILFAGQQICIPKKRKQL